MRRARRVNAACCAMQGAAVVDIKRPAQPSQLNEATKALHRMQGVCCCGCLATAHVHRSAAAHKMAQKRSMTKIDRARHAAARAFCTLTSLHLRSSLEFKRRRMAIALWGVLLCNERDVNCASNHTHQNKKKIFTSSFQCPISA